MNHNSNNNPENPQDSSSDDFSNDILLIEDDVPLSSAQNNSSSVAEVVAKTQTAQRRSPALNNSMVVDAIIVAPTERIDLVDTSLLKENPFNVGIYGDEPVDQDLVASLKEHGFQVPLICTSDHTLIAGHRRLKAAKELCITQVPVIIRGFDNDTDQRTALLESNIQRVKTNEMLGNEAIARKEIEAERAKERQRVAGTNKAAQGASNDGKSSKQQNGAARDKIGEQLGISGPTVDKLVQTASALRNLDESGKTAEAKALREKLNKSVSAGHAEAIRLGVISKAKPATKKTPEPTQQATPKSDKAETKTAVAAKAEVEVAIEPTAYEFGPIEDHAEAMRRIEQLISYVEEFGGEVEISAAHCDDWQEGIQSLTNALRNVGILSK